MHKQSCYFFYVRVMCIHTYMDICIYILFIRISSMKTIMAGGWSLHVITILDHLTFFGYDHEMIPARD